MAVDNSSTAALDAAPILSSSQRDAIEALSEPVLVLAGPGAGKTYCLIERIRFLIEQRGLDPERICVFTFTNKAAGEISSRLERRLQRRAERIKGGTIHSFCAELLREFGSHVGLEPGFGIANDEDQRSALRRLQVPPAWHGNLLARFAAYRFRGEPLRANDRTLFTRYEEFLAKRNLVDFDTLVLKAGQLLRNDAVGSIVRRRWDSVLVDEFQDLNPVQYGIIRELAREHRNVFAVGDDEQSIYSWAGADPQVFLTYTSDFSVTRSELRENRRCPREIVTLSRKLVMVNPQIFPDRCHADSARDCVFPVTALTFRTEDDEIAWIVDDLRRDHDRNGLGWGDFALLYRSHRIGDGAEASFLTAGIPCRLAQGRALAEDPVVRYLIAALGVIANPDDLNYRECFFEVVLPQPLFDAARAKAEEAGQTLLAYLDEFARNRPKGDADRSKIWRGFYALTNLAALGARHTSLSALVEELLSQRVGEYRTALEENHDELSDPAGDDSVQMLADRLQSAIETGRVVWIPRLGGVEIPLKGVLNGIGCRRIQLGGLCPEDAVSVSVVANSPLGLPLAVFKAAQLVRTRGFNNLFVDFTAIDLETTDNDITRAEIVDIGAVRVRNGKIVAEIHSLVRPRVPITEGALGAHGITEHDVSTAPSFEDVWAGFREFCGRDVIVAHNGYEFDFPILRRMCSTLGEPSRCTYDTLPLARELHSGGARLVDLAMVYGIDTGQSHRALDDARTLAHVFLRLGEAKVARARKTALVNLLDHLGVALALCDEETLCPEAKLLRRLARPYALGRYSDCLEFYRLECDVCRGETLVTLDELIDRLGGEKLMRRLRAEKSAAERYPAAMHRLRPLLECDTGKSLAEQITGFLDRVALSRADGTERDPSRVNLLTLHSTKGLEFSRVYIVGAEDGQLPGLEPTKAEIEEARRLLYVGMTRTIDRLVLTRVEAREGKPSGRYRFLDEMGIVPRPPARRALPS